MRVTPWVSHDRLDDEVMVINLKTGAYFAFQDAAADAWTLLVAGHDATRAAEQIAGRYSVDLADATADMVRFVDELEAEELMEPGDPGEAGAPSELAAVDVPRPYQVPSIDKYDDLQDLLLLDPIHEVAEAGWPSRGAED